MRRRLMRLVSPTFTMGALCLIERDDGCLLMLRHSYRPGWGLPGGIVKRGEPIEQAAHREVLEEVDLRIDLLGRPWVVMDPSVRSVDIVFSARPVTLEHQDGLQPVSPEIVEVRWFRRSDLQNLRVAGELQPEAIRAFEVCSLLTADAQAHGEGDATARSLMFGA